MQRSRRLISNELISFLKLIGALFLFAFIFRLIFYFLFKSTSDLGYTGQELRKALYIGAKFDMRAAILLSLPFWVFGYFFKTINYFGNEKERMMFWSEPQHPTKAIALIFSFISVLYAIFFLIDLGHYDYLKTRINSSVTVFLENPSISFQMLTESYPISFSILGLIILFVIAYLIFRKIIFTEKIFVSGDSVFTTPLKISISIFFLLAAIAHAKLSQYPLRWSEAYFTSNNFVTSLALNPLLYFYDTLAFKDSSYDVEKVKKHYNQVAKYLKVENPNIETLNFTRTISPFPAFETPPHVVVIMMESLASFKMTYFGQAMDGTPFLDSLIPKSIFFDNAYVTSTGTARSIFGTITGLPDVNSIKTASRNPLLVNQYSAANAFSDYNKSYFIGGSASWGNIRGFVSKSIENVNLFEEKDFKSGTNDVWGISDLKLFKEANAYLKAQTGDKQQFMFIQTAGYHRPYTIPKERGSFELKTLTEDEIKNNGFKSSDEFNSLRFSDYALSEFFKLAEQEDYFKNTLFVIYADHGLSHFKSDSVSKGFKRFALPVMHIPLLFYSPSMTLEPQVISKIAYQPDFLPSTVSLAGKTYTNKTLGRNLFDPKYDDKRFAFTISSFSPPVNIRLHDEKWISTGNVEKGLNGLFPYKEESTFDQNQSPESPEELDYRDSLARGLYETTKYLYYHSGEKKND